MKKIFNALKIIGIIVLLTGCNTGSNRNDSAPVTDRYEITDYQTNKQGFINSEGEIVIEAKYDGVEHFKDGLALIKETDSSGETVYGYIDRNGRTIIKPQYHYAFSFSEGLAKVRKDPDSPYIFINTSGRKVFELPSNVTNVRFFREGLAAVEINDKWGYIDKTGKIVIEPKYDEAVAFSEGLALVQLGKKSSSIYLQSFTPYEDVLYGYIDRTGKFVIEPKYKGASLSFSESLTVVYDSNSDNPLKVIDRDNNVVANISRAGCNVHLGYSEGLLPVKLKSKGGWRKCGFIDREGNVAIEPQFDDALPFSEGLAAIKVNGKWGFIDTTGTMIIEPQYDKVSYYFTNGLTSVTKKPLLPKAYIDREGNYVWKMIEY